MSGTKYIKVHVEPVRDVAQDDEGVAGEWVVEVHDTVPHKYLANVASYGFHCNVAIADLDSFEISYSCDGDDLEQSEDGEAAMYETDAHYDAVNQIDGEGITADIAAFNQPTN